MQMILEEYKHFIKDKLTNDKDSFKIGVHTMYIFSTAYHVLFMQ